MCSVVSVSHRCKVRSYLLISDDTRAWAEVGALSQGVLVRIDAILLQKQAAQLLCQALRPAFY